MFDFLNEGHILVQIYALINLSRIFTIKEDNRHSMTILYGASGHGKVIFEILEANGMIPDAVWDDAPKPDFWNYQVQKPLFKLSKENYEIVISIGDNIIRKRIAQRIAKKCVFLTAIHPDTFISDKTTIGEGTVIMRGVTINPDAVIGNHVILNTQAVIEHDCIINDFVHISPNVTLCGNITIGQGTHIGAGATIIPNIHIGANCIIAAGAVVREHIPDNVMVAGVPGAVKKHLK